MTRLAAERDTHLTAGEIAAETLRQFDRGDAEPSIRSLAAALKVKPAAIYHHFPSRAAIIEAAVKLAWEEVGVEGYGLVPDPLAAEADELLVAIGLATRRVWRRHYRLAPYMAATPESTEFLTNALAVFANAFERLGFEGEEAAARFHTYAVFTLGAVLFAAARQVANEQLERGSAGQGFRSEHDPEAASTSNERTRIALDAVMEVSAVDPERDEELFVAGLRRLIASFGPGTAPPPSRTEPS